MKPLALALDRELLRTATEEDVPLDELINGVAQLIGKTPRMLYNYRSGKWDLPSSLIPILCTRFKSHALLDALSDEVKNIPVEVLQKIDFSQLSIQILRLVCDHHYELLEAYKSEQPLDLNQLNRLEEQTAKVIQQERLLFTLLEAEREQQMSLRRKEA